MRELDRFVIGEVTDAVDDRAKCLGQQRDQVRTYAAMPGISGSPARAAAQRINSIARADKSV